MTDILDALLQIQIDERIMTFVPILIIIGKYLKNTPKFPDWLIAWTLLLLSLFVSVFMYGFNFDGILSGLVAAGSAVFSHQLYKQTIEGIAESKLKKLVLDDTSENDEEDPGPDDFLE